MKLLPLSGFLLLSVSPAAAENLVYLKCKNQMTLASTEISTGKLINEEQTREELLYLKIDPVGNRFMTFNPSAENQNNQCLGCFASANQCDVSSMKQMSTTFRASLLNALRW